MSRYRRNSNNLGLGDIGETETDFGRTSECICKEYILCMGVESAGMIQLSPVISI